MMASERDVQVETDGLPEPVRRWSVAWAGAALLAVGAAALFWGLSSFVAGGKAPWYQAVLGTGLLSATYGLLVLDRLPDRAMARWWVAAVLTFTAVALREVGAPVAGLGLRDRPPGVSNRAVLQWLIGAGTILACAGVVWSIMVAGARTRPASLRHTAFRVASATTAAALALVSMVTAGFEQGADSYLVFGAALLWPLVAAVVCLAQLGSTDRQGARRLGRFIRGWGWCGVALGVLACFFSLVVSMAAGYAAPAFLVALLPFAVAVLAGYGAVVRLGGQLATLGEPTVHGALSEPAAPQREPKIPPLAVPTRRESYALLALAVVAAAGSGLQQYARLERMAAGKELLPHNVPLPAIPRAQLESLAASSCAEAFTRRDPVDRVVYQQNCDYYRWALRHSAAPAGERASNGVAQRVFAPLRALAMLLGLLVVALGATATPVAPTSVSAEPLWARAGLAALGAALAVVGVGLWVAEIAPILTGEAVTVLSAETSQPGRGLLGVAAYLGGIAFVRLGLPDATLRRRLLAGIVVCGVLLLLV